MSSAGLARPRTGAVAGAAGGLADPPTRRRAGRRAASVSVAPERRYRGRDPLAHSGSAVRKGLGVALRAGREVVATAMYVDLRNSTRLAAGRLPFDTIFIVNRYIEAATAAILAEGRHITSIPGDGIMTVFGLDGDAKNGARKALAAAFAVGRARHRDRSRSRRRNRRAAPDWRRHTYRGFDPRRDRAACRDRSSLQFLGDTGNVAARLGGFDERFSLRSVDFDGDLSGGGPVGAGAGARRRFRSGAAARWRRCGSTRWRIWLCWRGREARTKKRTRRFPPPCGRRCKRDSRRRQAPRDARATPLAQQEAAILQKLSVRKHSCPEPDHRAADNGAPHS